MRQISEIIFNRMQVLTFFAASLGGAFLKMTGGVSSSAKSEATSKSLLAAANAAFWGAGSAPTATGLDSSAPAGLGPPGGALAVEAWRGSTLIFLESLSCLFRLGPAAGLQMTPHAY